MPENDVLRRLLDAGVHFTQLTQQRAEAIVRDLVKAGEVQTEQAQSAVADLLERSRQNTEKFVEAIRGEVKNQMGSLESASREAYARLEKQVAEIRAQLPKPGRRPVGKAAAAPKQPAPKKPAKKSSGKKAAAKKASKKKAAAKKPAKKAAAKNSAG